MELQTPEQLQFASNLAHWIEGVVFAIVAIIALLRARNYFTWKGAEYLWPSLIVMAGLFLPAYIFLQGGLSRVADTWRFSVNDPQQREHFLMAAFLVLAGAAEIAAEAKIVQGTIWRLITPGALVAIGIVLLVHTEYGTVEAIAESVTEHRYQGILVILVGLFKGAEALWRHRFRWLAYPWIVVLFITALLLTSYREPPGAYRTAYDSHKRLMIDVI
ncbi:MAG TPA: hypothetical protein PLK77_05865 [Pyrinomonadaceae bacterium]|nr:hypothetical protein [Pyrinomonadaceae bacterium]